MKPTYNKNYRTRIYLLLFFLLLLANNNLLSQTEDFKKEFQEALDEAEIEPAEPVKPDLSLDNTRCVELSVGSFRLNFLPDEETSFASTQTNGNFYLIKYKKEIYKDQINSLSVGLAYQRNNFTYYATANSDQDASYDDSYYRLRTTQEINSVGVLTTNRFRKKIGPVGLFVDMELSAFFKMFSNEKIELDEIYRLKNQSNYDEYPDIPLQSERNVEIPYLISYFSISPGLEFTIRKKVNLYFSYSFGRNINSFYNPVVVHPAFFPINDLFFFSESLNIGLRF